MTQCRAVSRTLSLAALLAATAAAQTPAVLGLAGATHLIVPQSRAFPLHGGRGGVTIERVAAHVDVVEQTARTALDIVLRNDGPRRAEAVLLLPVPPGAAIHRFAFAGGAAEPTARLLEHDEARRTYDGIVRRLRDPALLEFAACDLVRSSVFPLPAGGRQQVQISYDHLLQADGNRIDFVLPRSESLQQAAPWKITVDLRSKCKISTVYSPTHTVVTERRDAHHVTARLADDAARQPGSFLLSYLLERGDSVAASLFSYPDPSIGGGYFLLLAGLPASTDAARKGLRREVTLVLDRSGSMAGAKMDQAKAAALQVIEGLEDGEGFNVIDYATTVQSFAPAPVRRDRDAVTKARRYLASLRPRGGTNIHDALVEALRQKPLPGTLPIVLFLTDGLPTVGQTAETAIRATVEAGNPHHRRVFTFGVGQDVNVPLLDRIAEITRGTTTYVLPLEDVEVKVARVFNKLYGPVLSDVELRTLDARGELDCQRVRELQPAKLPDLFEHDRLVVLGQYRGDAPLCFALEGRYLGKPRQFRFTFGLTKATTRNAFVPRLWASRRIAYLIDQVRQAGATAAAGPSVGRTDPFADPRLRELRDEILRLSTEFGILSEYTAFLATEGTRLSDWQAMARTCGNELDGRAIRDRVGLGALNQGANIRDQKNIACLNYRNRYLDDNLQRVEVSNVQQVNDRAFFQRGNRWVDGRAIVDGKLQPDETIRLGSKAHDKLLQRLIGEGRCGVLSLQGEILLRIGKHNVLVVNEDQQDRQERENQENHR